MSKKDEPSGAGCAVALMSFVVNGAASYWLVTFLTAHYGSEDPITWWLGFMVSVVLLQAPSVIVTTLVFVGLVFLMVPFFWAAQWARRPGWRGVR